MSRRRLLGAVFGALVIVAATVPAAAIARSPQRVDGHRSVEKVPFTKGLKVKPGQLIDKTADVVVQLGAKPVAVRQGEALDVGRKLNKTEKATIRAELKRTQDGLRSKIAALGGRVLGQYQDALNGIKVRINLRQVGKLRQLAGVTSVDQLPTYKVDNVHGVPYVGAPLAWGDYGYTGQGIKIGIIDTGIDYYHANFGGSGDPDEFANDDSTIIEPGTFPTAKVAGGYDFAGDDYDATGDEGSPIPSPDPDPLDCVGTSPNVGHGSHVAGTAAGDGVLANGSTFTGPYNKTTVSSNSWKIGPGVAPQATLYAYRVFGCAGSTDLVVDAINRAVMDGVDVINMSLGSPFGRDDTIDAIATNNAVRAGVIVSTSAGNEGPNAYMVGSPGTATGALASAALDALPSFPGATITGAGSPINAINQNASPDLPFNGDLFVASDGAGGLLLGCDAGDYTGINPGEIAVIQRGVCAFVDKGAAAEAAGAAAVIVVNRDDIPDPNELPTYIGPVSQFSIPMIGTGRGAKAQLIAADGDSVTVTAAGTIASPTYKHLASFSSGGPRSGDAALKPDVASPGVSIVSTFSGSGTEGQTLSGTSMASPHTTGVAALVQQAHPTWSPTQVKAAIMSTGRIISAGSGLFDYDPRLEGAGVVQARRAVDTRAYLIGGSMQASLSYNYDPRSASYTEAKTLSIYNDGGSALTYHLSGHFTGSSFGASVTVSPSTVTVPAHNHKNVTVTLALTSAEMRALPSQDDIDITDVTSIAGYITAAPTTSGTGRYTLHAPFLAVPRSVSSVSTGLLAPYVAAGSTATSSFKISNAGNHAGNADVYQWGITDANDGVAEADVRAVGFQSLPPDVAGLDPDDVFVAFAVNTWGRWSNAASNEIDVLLDTTGDGDPDWAVIGIDFGAVSAGDFNGEMVSLVVNLGTGTVVAVWDAFAPTDGSTAILYMAASDIGWSDGDGPINVSVNTFSLAGLGDDETGSAWFDPFNPAVSNGDYIHLVHGASVTEPAAVDLDVQADAPAHGWFVLANDDANGAAQVDLVPIGTLPAGP